MIIGIPKEIKQGEGRVALLPKEVKRLVALGAVVLVEEDAGIMAGASDADYLASGADLVKSSTLWKRGELIAKVKEILPAEFPLLNKEHILFTNLHSAADSRQLDQLLDVGLIAIAAEETHPHGSPNSTLAGEIGALEGVRLLFACHGGSGRHFMHHFGAAQATALVIGLGGVGQGALRTLLGLGLRVKGYDNNSAILQSTELHWYKNAPELYPIARLREHLPVADLIINCVKWDKSRKDHLISREMLHEMAASCALIDIACDEGGAIETCRPTSWDDPVYLEEGRRHFCVDNLPGASPVTASAGYSRAIYPHIEAIYKFGVLEACRLNKYLAAGLTCYQGELLLAEAGKVQSRAYQNVTEWLSRE